MQAIVIPPLRWTLVLSLTGFFLPATTLGAQQLERYAMSENEVAICNLTGQVRLEPGTGGDVTVQVTAPQVSLETGSGSVTADLSGEVWNVKVETGSGDVTLKVPPTLAAEVDIETSSGDIETDFEVAVTRHARDHMTGRIGDGGGKIAIETGSGGIKLVKGGQ